MSLRSLLKNKHTPQTAPLTESLAENRPDPTAVRAKLQEKAAGLGSNIGAQVIDSLVSVAESGVSFSEGLEAAYGLRIRPPVDKPLLIGGRDGRWISGVSQIDFRPVTANAPHGAETPQSEEVLPVVQKALHGLQAFCLLVETGYLERPTGLVTVTNWQMTKVAGKVGFSETDRTRLDDEQRRGFSGPREMAEHERSRQHEIYAGFDEVARSVLSEQAQRFEELLITRMAAQHVGSAAVHGGHPS